MQQTIEEASPMSTVTPTDLLRPAYEVLHYMTCGVCDRVLYVYGFAGQRPCGPWVHHGCLRYLHAPPLRFVDV